MSKYSSSDSMTALSMSCWSLLSMVGESNSSSMAEAIPSLQISEV